VDEEIQTEQTGDQVRAQRGFANAAEIQDGPDDSPGHCRSADPAGQDLSPQDRTSEGRDRHACEHHVVPLQLEDEPSASQIKGIIDDLHYDADEIGDGAQPGQEAVT
jgi:hypothetical protein